MGLPCKRNASYHISITNAKALLYVIGQLLKVAPVTMLSSCLTLDRMRTRLREKCLRDERVTRIGSHDNSLFII